jgi:hypothetical protein
MWRAAIVSALALCALGCGATPERVLKPQPAECPEGTPALTARDVIGPVPRDYEVVAPGRPKLIEEVAAGFRQDIGESYRSHDARVIVPRGEIDGTAVIVVNTHEGRPEDIVVGAKSAEGKEGVVGERLDIDGREGRLQHTTDESSGFIAMAPTGRCSVVLLLSDKKPTLQDAAALIGARG